MEFGGFEEFIVDQISFDADAPRAKAGFFESLFGDKEKDIDTNQAERDIIADSEGIEGAESLARSTAKLDAAIDKIESRLGGVNLSNPFSIYDYNAPPEVMRAEFEAVTEALNDVEQALKNLEVSEDHPHYDEIVQRRDGLLKQIAHLKETDLNPRLYPEFRSIPTLEDGRTLYLGNGGYGQAKTCGARAEQILDLIKSRTT